MIEEGGQGTSIEKYNLPVCDVMEEKRNFPGMKKNVYYNLADMQDMNSVTNTTDDE
jgi:hypothetical protein